MNQNNPIILLFPQGPPGDTGRSGRDGENVSSSLLPSQYYSSHEYAMCGTKIITLAKIFLMLVDSKKYAFRDKGLMKPDFLAKR